MSRSKRNPPFRADHVGSLLRPEQVLRAREQAANGEITPEEQRQVEDDAIAGMIPKLEATGIQSITDGEYRRAWFHLDFLEQLDGVTVTGMIASSSDSEGRVGMAPPKITVTGKLAHKHDIQVADYQFVDAHTDRLPKVAIPSPTMAHFRGGRAGIDIESYPDLDVFFEDLAQVYRDEIAALYAAGARYIQLDDTNLAYLCDPKCVRGLSTVETIPTSCPGHMPLSSTQLSTREKTTSRSVFTSVGATSNPPTSPLEATSPSPKFSSTSLTLMPTSWSTTTNGRVGSLHFVSFPTTRRSFWVW